MRSEVMWFAHQMQKKLDQRMADKTGWLRTHNKELMARMMDEVEELLEAMQHAYKPDLDLEETRGAFDDMLRECVDVANFAMMIADKCRLVLA